MQQPLRDEACRDTQSTYMKTRHVPVTAKPIPLPPTTCLCTALGYIMSHVAMAVLLASILTSLWPIENSSPFPAKHFMKGSSTTILLTFFFPLHRSLFPVRQDTGITHHSPPHLILTDSPLPLFS